MPPPRVDPADPAQVVAGQGLGVQVEVAVGVALLVAEVALGGVAALLEHDHVQAGPGQLARDHPAAGARADHDHVAGQLCSSPSRRRGAAAGGVGGRAQRPGIAGGVAGRAGPAVGGQQGQRGQGGGQPPPRRASALRPGGHRGLGRGRRSSGDRRRVAGEGPGPGPGVERPPGRPAAAGGRGGRGRGPAAPACGRARPGRRPARGSRRPGRARPPAGRWPRRRASRRSLPTSWQGCTPRGLPHQVVQCVRNHLARGGRPRRRRWSWGACTGASGAPWCSPASTCASTRASCTG